MAGAKPDMDATHPAGVTVLGEAVVQRAAQDAPAGDGESFCAAGGAGSRVVGNGGGRAVRRPPGPARGRFVLDTADAGEADAIRAVGVVVAVAPGSVAGRAARYGAGPELLAGLIRWLVAGRQLDVEIVLGDGAVPQKPESAEPVTHGERFLVPLGALLRSVSGMASLRS